MDAGASPGAQPQGRPEAQGGPRADPAAGGPPLFGAERQQPQQTFAEFVMPPGLSTGGSVLEQALLQQGKLLQEAVSKMTASKERTSQASCIKIQPQVK